MSKHRFQYASGEIPFAGETKPGLSKVAPGGREELHKVAAPAARVTSPKLPPPPCPRVARLMMSRQPHIPLPPCTFQDRTSSYPTSGRTWEDDPFLAAYMECTGSDRDPAGRVASPKQKKKTTANKKGCSRKEAFGIPSCKNVRDVVEDGVVRLSRLPSAQLRRGNAVAGKWRVRDLFPGAHVVYP